MGDFHWRERSPGFDETLSGKDVIGGGGWGSPDFVGVGDVFFFRVRRGMECIAGARFGERGILLRLRLRWSWGEERRSVVVESDFQPGGEVCWSSCCRRGDKGAECDRVAVADVVGHIWIQLHSIQVRPMSGR